MKKMEKQRNDQTNEFKGASENDDKDKEEDDKEFKVECRKMKF